jgi:8-oxo-dGTP pyrophosphatase MutT (NUDIX family)
MKQDMRNLLFEIRKARDSKAHEFFGKFSIAIGTLCKEFYEETGCTISEIKFPVENIYIIDKEGPFNVVPMLPEIAINELSIK